MYPEVEFQTTTISKSFSPFNESLQELYYEETGKPCKYPRGEKEYFTNEFTQWIKKKQNKEKDIQLDPRPMPLEILRRII